MIRVVLCGYGPFGRVYARRIRELPGMNLVGVVELGAVQDAVHGSVQDAVRADGLRPFDTLREALDVTHPRLVVVATSAEAQAMLAVEALTRYVDVMLAKPGALGMDEADRIRTAAWSHQRRVVVDYTPTMSPAWHRLVATPWPDGILTVRMVRRGVAAYRSCGVLWDLAPHDVAMALQLDASDTVVDVTAHGWMYPGYDEPVGAFVLLTHQSGRTTRIEVDWMAAATERRVEVVEHERMHVWDQMTDAIGWTRRGYRCDDRGVVKGVWDLDVDAYPVRYGPDNVTRALTRAIDKSTDDSWLLRDVTRILEAADESMCADRMVRVHA